MADSGSETYRASVCQRSAIRNRLLPGARILPATMSLLELEVTLHGLCDALALGVGRRAHDAARYTEHERVWRNAHVFAADSTRADDRPAAYLYTVEQNRAHPD